LLTALAFAHFAAKGVDFQVLEVGLGGKFDATNVITPEVCIITSISLDHTEVLGNSLAEIAGEKAGIIKPGGIVVLSPQPDEVVGVIKNACKSRGAGLVREEPVLGPMFAPVLAQEVECSLREGNVAILLSLAVADGDGHSTAIDVLGAKVDGFGDPQTAGVHHDGAHAGGRATDVGQEFSDLRAAEDHRELVIASEADQIENGHWASEGVTEKELDGEEVQA